MTMRVQGLSRTLRQMEKAGAAASDLRDVMQRIGNVVVVQATPRLPAVSGRLSTTIRAGRSKTKAVVRLGGARAPYAGVIEYGWPARNITAQPALRQALDAKRGEILATLTDEIDHLLTKTDLK